MNIAVLLLSGFQPVQTQKDRPDQGCRLERGVNTVQFRKVFKPLAKQTVISSAYFPGRMAEKALGFEHRIDGLTGFQVETFMFQVGGNQEGIARKPIEFLTGGKLDSASPGNKIEQFPASVGMELGPIAHKNWSLAVSG